MSDIGKRVRPALFVDGKKVSGYRQSLKTIERYLDEFRQFFGNAPVREITYQHLRAFRDHLSSTPTKKGNLPAASTYHKKLTILGKMFTIAVQMDWLDVSPFRRGAPLIRRTLENRRNRMLTYEEEAALIDAARDKRAHLRLFIFCSLDAAMRRGEIYNLRWRQVDFENQVIYLTDDAAAETKTGVGGILPLTARLADELQRIQAVSPHTLLDDLVIGRVNIKRAWGTACRMAGIGQLQLRDLRATGSTRMLLAGNAGDLVRKITRHQLTETFLDHYTAIDVANAQLVGRKLEKFNEKQTAEVEAKGKVKSGDFRRVA